MSFYWIDYRDNVFQFYKRLYKQVGSLRYRGYYFMLQPKLIIRDPDLIKEVFVKNADKFAKGVTLLSKNDPFTRFIFNMVGAEWKEIRAHITPAFSIAKIKQMQSLVVAPAVTMQDIVVQRIYAGRNIMNPSVIILPYLTDVFAACLFGINAETTQFPRSQFLKMVARLPGNNRVVRIIRAFTHNLPGKWRHLVMSRILDEEATDFFAHLIVNIVKYRKENKVTGSDFLQYFMDLAESNEANNSEKEEHKWTLESIIVHCIIFLYNGLVEPPIIINNALYELAKNSDIQAKLRGEIDKHAIGSNGEMNFEMLSEMAYLDQIVLGLSRRCTETCRLSNDELLVEKGTTATISVAGRHHDSEFYPEPEKFDPERFSKENREKRHPYCYIPFGCGPRACSAERFVMYVAKAAIVSIVSQFEVTVLPENLAAFEFDMGEFSTRPKGVKLVFTQKQSCAEI